MKKVFLFIITLSVINCGSINTNPYKNSNILRFVDGTQTEFVEITSWPITTGEIVIDPRTFFTMSSGGTDVYFPNPLSLDNDWLNTFRSVAGTSTLLEDSEAYTSCQYPEYNILLPDSGFIGYSGVVEMACEACLADNGKFWWREAGMESNGFRDYVKCECPIGKYGDLDIEEGCKNERNNNDSCGDYHQGATKAACLACSNAGHTWDFAEFKCRRAVNALEPAATSTATPEPLATGTPMITIPAGSDIVSITVWPITTGSILVHPEDDADFNITTPYKNDAEWIGQAVATNSSWSQYRSRMNNCNDVPHLSDDSSRYIDEKCNNCLRTDGIFWLDGAASKCQCPLNKKANNEFECETPTSDINRCDDYSNTITKEACTKCNSNGFEWDINGAFCKEHHGKLRYEEECTELYRTKWEYRTDIVPENLFASCKKCVGSMGFWDATTITGENSCSCPYFANEEGVSNSCLEYFRNYSDRDIINFDLNTAVPGMFKTLYRAGRVADYISPVTYAVTVTPVFTRIEECNVYYERLNDYTTRSSCTGCVITAGFDWNAETNACVAETTLAPVVEPTVIPTVIPTVVPTVIPVYTPVYNPVVTYTPVPVIPVNAVPVINQPVVSETPAPLPTATPAPKLTVSDVTLVTINISGGATTENLEGVTSR